MNPVVEKVAEAIAEDGDDYFWWLLTPDEREPYYRRASAAIEALGLTKDVEGVPDASSQV